MTHGAMQTLSPAECLDLLEPGGVGRVGFVYAGEIVMLPVNFAVTGKTVVFRTAPDTLLARHADARVSFEADDLDLVLHEGWSVLVQGHAHRVTDEHTVKCLEDGTRLEPWAPGARDVYVRVVATRITGRRIKPAGDLLRCGRRAGNPERRVPASQSVASPPGAHG